MQYTDRRPLPHDVDAEMLAVLRRFPSLQSTPLLTPWHYQFRHAPQPPNSPDISPCDFGLFDNRKTKPPDQESGTLDEFLGRIRSHSVTSPGLRGCVKTILGILNVLARSDGIIVRIKGFRTPSRNYHRFFSLLAPLLDDDDHDLFVDHNHGRNAKQPNKSMKEKCSWNEKKVRLWVIQSRFHLFIQMRK
jgi:hypothetical protein